MVCGSDTIIAIVSNIQVYGIGRFALWHNNKIHLQMHCTTTSVMSCSAVHNVLLPPPNDMIQPCPVSDETFTFSLLSHASVVMQNHLATNALNSAILPLMDGTTQASLASNQA